MDSGALDRTRDGVAQVRRTDLSPGEVSVWGRLFQSSDPRQLVEWIEDEDPLGLVEQTALRLRQLAILHDVDQVHARVVARAAYEGARGEAPVLPRHVETRLNRWIDRSVEELAAEDRAELRRGHRGYESWDPRYVFLTRVLGVPAESTRQMCVAFNGLGREVRRSFFAITIEGLTVEVSAQREGFAPDVLRERVLAGFGALLGRGRTPLGPRASEAVHENAVGTFIDPTVRGALGSLAGSQLFSTRDPRSLAGVAGLVDAAGIRHPGRQVLERHLARVAQHEVAWLLRHAVIAHLFGDPETARWLHRSISTRRRHRPMPLEAIRLRAAGFKAMGTLFDPFADEIALLERTTAGRASAARVPELCTASRALFPSDQPLVCVAFQRIARGDHENGRELLGEVLADHPTDLHRSIVRENLGLADARSGELEAAVEHYRAAACTSELRPGPVISWLHTAALAGDTAQLLEAATALDDLVSPEHVAVTERCQRPGHATSHIPRRVAATVESVRQHLGPTALTLTDAYFAPQPCSLSAAATVGPVEAELLE